MDTHEIVGEFLKDISLTLHEKDMIFIKNDRYEYVYWNDEYENFLIDKLQANPREIKGKTDFCLYPLEAAEKCRESDMITKERGHFIGSEFIDTNEYIITKLKLKESDIPKGGILTLAKLVSKE